MRKGMVGPIIAIALILAGIVLMTVLSGVTETTAGEELEVHLQNVYSGNVLGEEIMSAGCATVSRGVFKEGAVISGDFNCTIVRRPVNVRFKFSGRTYDWVLRKGVGGVRVSKPGGNPSFSQSYSVLVYDQVTGEYENATLKVGER